MSADITAGPATGATSFVFPRHEQTFPTLTPPEIERMRRFGEPRSFKHGDALFETGKPGPGMFVVLSGHVAITQRDGLGHVTPVIDQGPGQFLAEIGQLSDRVALVDGHAEGDVETLLIAPERLRALLVAEADLGERIMRALILRRVSLIQGGVGGPVLIGPSNASSVIRLQGFLTRNGYPVTVLDAHDDAEGRELVERFGMREDDLPLLLCANGTLLKRPTDQQAGVCLGITPELDPHIVYDVAVVGAGPQSEAPVLLADRIGESPPARHDEQPAGTRVEDLGAGAGGRSGDAHVSRASRRRISSRCIARSVVSS